MKMKTTYLIRRGRMNPKEDKAFPAILAFKYSEFVRARGELMVKQANTKRPSWSQVLLMSDAEFLAYYQTTAAELASLQQEVEQTAEIDITDKQLYRHIGRLQNIEEAQAQKNAATQSS